MHERIVVTGGFGYVGCSVVPELLRRGFEVVVLDLMLYQPRAPMRHPRLRAVRGDVRDGPLLRSVLRGGHGLIHLAGVSLEGTRLDPAVGRSINVDCMEMLLRECVRAGLRRFAFASSCSVYGAAGDREVDETARPGPVGPYARAKLECEEIAGTFGSEIGVTLVRAATVCGASPRQRLDLLVNRLVAHSVLQRRLVVSDPARIRPSVHVTDLAGVYATLLQAPLDAVADQVFNVAYENHTVLKTSRLVAAMTGAGILVDTDGEQDPRSYRVCSDRIASRVGFVPARGVRDAVEELAAALRRGQLRDPLRNPLFYNREIEAQKLAAGRARDG